jgi:hypothetical protein
MNVSIFYINLAKVQTDISKIKNCILLWTEGEFFFKKLPFNQELIWYTRFKIVWDYSCNELSYYMLKVNIIREVVS